MTGCGVSGHRVVEEWMGRQVETLEDLLQPDLRAVCVGINPAPPSVAAGHYYQGRLGQQFFRRLREAGVLDRESGFDDDFAFANGVGFTDIVKRPTATARDLRAAEFEHGKRQLLEKLERYRPDLVIFTFKKTAQVLVGAFAGNGIIDGLRVAQSDAFVMPGPYEESATAAATLRQLAKYWRP